MLYNQDDLKPSPYKQIFGSKGLGSNTFIYNNRYQTGSGFGSVFLSSALFFTAGRNSARSWSSDDDSKWRSTTQAPYFANKIPGSDKKLPAAAVIGAATAFGLVSLLPLNVPANEPLMYCDDSEIAQSPMRIRGRTYSCSSGRFEISFPLEHSTRLCECHNQTVDCGYGKYSDDFHCSGQTLFSKLPITCFHFETKNRRLYCYVNEFPDDEGSFIPTKAPITSEKELSLKSKTHIFFMNLVGKSDVIEKARKGSKAKPTASPDPHKVPWVPEALTIPEESKNSKKHGLEKLFMPLSLFVFGTDEKID
jgi:hypothetical protein